MKKTFRVIKKILNVICILFIAVMVVIIAVSAVSRISGSTPSFFGYTIYRVSSGSMEPELMVGDVILDKDVDDPDSLQVGDTITFIGTGALDGMTVTHKVIKPPYDDNGVMKLQTCGIANEIPDDPIPTENVRGIYVCKLAVLDVIYSVFLSPWGLLIIIGLLIFIFFGELLNIVKVITGNEKSEKDADDINEIIERMQRENILETDDFSKKSHNNANKNKKSD